MKEIGDCDGSELAATGVNLDGLINKYFITTLIEQHRQRSALEYASRHPQHFSTITFKFLTTFEDPGFCVNYCYRYRP